MNLLKQSMLPLLIGISFASASACSDTNEDEGGQTVFQLVGGGTSCDNNGGPIAFEIYIIQNGESPVRVTLELAGPEGQNPELHNATMASPFGGNERWLTSLSECIGSA